MWEYKKEIIKITDPDKYSILSEMNIFGDDNWEIFSITESVVERWSMYGEPHEEVEYVLYMKKLK